MAGFFKMFKRLNSNVLGVVTGADFKNGSYPFAYLGKGEKSDKDKLMIYGPAGNRRDVLFHIIFIIDGTLF